MADRRIDVQSSSQHFRTLSHAQNANTAAILETLQRETATIVANARMKMAIFKANLYLDLFGPGMTENVGEAFLDRAIGSQDDVFVLEGAQGLIVGDINGDLR